MRCFFKSLGQLRAFGFAAQSSETVGTTPLVHDDKARERAKNNYELFLASAVAQPAAPAEPDAAAEPADPDAPAEGEAGS